MEEWRKIITFSGGVIEVSNMGNVRNAITGKVYSLKGEVASRKSKGNGYIVISVGYKQTKSGKRVAKTFYVHHLVAEAFLGPRPPNMQINHLNGNKHDNRVENMEYCTPSQNTQHAYDIGLYKGIGK